MTASGPACDSDHDPASLAIDVAWERVLAALTPITGTERLPLRSALGRVLAAPLHAGFDVPAHTNSAMDGYALHAGGLDASGGGVFRCCGSALAGHPHTGMVPAGSAVRIMTGAPMPAGTDTVIVQERVRVSGDRLEIEPGQTAGQNVRAAGEDLAAGQRVFAAGRRIGIPELGVLGSLGLTELEVRRRLRVAYFSTGDELRSAGDVLAPGEIYDSNRYTLYAALHAPGIEAMDLGVVRDDPASLRAAFEMAAATADVILSSGGVSVGDADHIKTLLEQLGRVGFWKLAMRPGRPLAFGAIAGTPFFGLPGNPVSVAATWFQFVRPALRHLAGEAGVRRPRGFPARTLAPLKKRPGRVEFQRGILDYADDGTPVVDSTGEQGSGMLSSLANGNCFIVLPHDAGPIAAGELVEVQPLYGVIDQP